MSTNKIQDLIQSRRLKVDLVEFPLSAECVNKMTMTAKDTVTAMIYTEPLKEVEAAQIMNATNFEAIKALGIVAFLMNESVHAQLS